MTKKALAKRPRVTDHGAVVPGYIIRAALKGELTQLSWPLSPQPSAFSPGPNVHAPKHPAAYFDAYCGQPKRPSNPRGKGPHWCWWTPDDRQGDDWIECPFGQPGDTVWLKEEWCLAHPDYHSREEGRALGRPFDPAGKHWCWYASTDDCERTNSNRSPWYKASTMQRWMARVVRQVVDVQVWHIQDIATEQQMEAEGLDYASYGDAGDIWIKTSVTRDRKATGDTRDWREAYSWHWDACFPGHPWAGNPWAWRVTLGPVPALVTPNKIKTTCPTCKGTGRGKINTSAPENEDCDTCAGYGEIYEYQNP